MPLPWNPATILRMVRGYTAMSLERDKALEDLKLAQEKADALTLAMGILKSENYVLKVDARRDGKTIAELQNMLNTFERKHHLALPIGGQEFPLSQLEPLLPVPPWQRTDDPLLALPAAEWERFLTWVAPIARYAGYYPNRLDCEDLNLIALGRASEWKESLAKGMCYGLTAGGTPHAWGFVFSLHEEGPVLAYFDLTPRSIVPAWGPEGLAYDLPPGWRIEELTWL